MGDTIRLASETPCAIGGKRLVFAHPTDPSLVIKVMRPEFGAGEFGTEPLWARLVRRYHFSTGLLRELREQVKLRFEGDSYPRFLSPILAFVDTDLGPGLVSRAARDEHGGFAPTLKALIDRGAVDERVLADLERFCASVRASSIVVGDLNIGNIVHAYDPVEGPHFVLIDGVGDKTFVPLLRISGFLSRRAKNRKIARLMKAVRREYSRPVRQAEPPLAQTLQFD
jgi:hypothetical protein